MKKLCMWTLLFILMLSICIPLGAIPAFADSPAEPEPYKVVLAGGEKVFYVTPQGEETETDLKSGLYYNTQPATNIYYVDENDSYFAYTMISGSNLCISDDGIYFAHFPWSVCHWTPDPSDANLSGDAIIFYENGIKTKTYSVDDLLKDPTKGSYSVSHVMWEDYDERTFDPQTNVLTVTAGDGLVYQFDITTGMPLIEEEPEHTITFIYNGKEDEIETVNGKVTPPANPVKHAYVFKGWSLTENGNVINLNTFVFEKDETLYAQWDEQKHNTICGSITLDTNTLIFIFTLAAAAMLILFAGHRQKAKHSN